MRLWFVVDTTRSVGMASAVEDTDKWVRLFLGEPDILRRILRSLPKWKDVLNCRLVCRQWMEEIEKDHDFWERVSNVLTFLYQTVPWIYKLCLLYLLANYSNLFTPT